MAIMKMSMEEARDYCDRLDAAKGKHVLNDYYALKKRWNEQQRHG